MLWMGCVTGSLKNVDLSSEIPPEIVQRFQTHEAIKVVSPPAVKLRHQKKVFKIPVRRASREPFRVFEKLVFSMSYLGVTAGEFTMEVLPLKVLHDRKVYPIQAKAVTSSVFSLFYRIQDQIESFMDYEGIFSHQFHLSLDETGQKRESFEFHDHVKKKTSYWDRLVRPSKPMVERKQESHFEPYAQDSLSALFYLRHIPWKEGKVIEFPVIAENKVTQVTCHVFRREERETLWGRVPTLMLQLETQFQGLLKKTGDSFLWITDDDRKIPIRFEAKIRVGSIVAELIRADLGTKEFLD